MQSKPKKIIYLERILRFMATAILWKYKPKIVGITGSVGKTSAKEAVFLALAEKYRVRKSEKNYNNEIGIPLTVLGSESAGKSILKWTEIFFKWLAILIFPVKYPEILVLEMGVDRPKDMKYLLRFIHPTAGIITNISSSHLEFFKSVEQIAREKGKLVEILTEKGVAILNADDKEVMKMKSRIKASVITFGIRQEAQIRATDIIFNYKNEIPSGISFKLNYDRKIIPVRLPYILAPHQIYSVLAAIAVAKFFGVGILDAANSLEKFRSPQGRMNLLEGAEETFIIDDTYNSSPSSALAALDVLKLIRAGRKIVVLGDMLELGEDSEPGHQRVAEKIPEVNPTLVFTVGEHSANMLKFLRAQGYSSRRLFAFNNPDTAGEELKKQIQSGDLILVKGSRSMRMEKIVARIMRNP